MAKLFDVCILGATGAVGGELLSILEERKFPLRNLYPLASKGGRSVRFAGRELEVIDVAQFDFSRAQIGLFSAGASVSATYAPRAAAAGCIVIDNTSQFRYEAEIPLVVPEVNAAEISAYRRRNIIANPNCSTIQMLVALKPIYDVCGIERINVATYQAVSGTGKEAMDELEAQTRAYIAGEPLRAEVYPTQIAFNVLPHVDKFEPNGYTKEEMKMVWVTPKIMGDATIRVNPTTVRVPVFVGHAEAVHIETKEKISATRARELLANAPGVELIDERADRGYPTPAIHAAGRDAVFVGRIREDISHPRGLNLWVVSDNLRKGAALNSIQIAEKLIDDYLQ
jgi:aspartate-semialdehyde dehydrogenase